MLGDIRWWYWLGRCVQENRFEMRFCSNRVRCKTRNQTDRFTSHNAPKRTNADHATRTKHSTNKRNTSEFNDFSSREGPPAPIFHEIWKFRISATDLDLQKSHVKRIFLDTAAQPIPPANIPQQTDGRKLKSVGPILRNLRKRDQDARKSG